MPRIRKYCQTAILKKGKKRIWAWMRPAFRVMMITIKRPWRSTCLDCHDMEAFKPAPKFDHDQAEFQLKGEHATVDCIECHQMTNKNGKEFQEFTGIPFKTVFLVMKIHMMPKYLVNVPNAIPKPLLKPFRRARQI